MNTLIDRPRLQYRQALTAHCEAMFMLFRVTTGEDWTDIRYNLIDASRRGLVHVPTYVITTFHITWFSISAFLLLNLIVGAVVNNYQIIMEEMRREAKHWLIKSPSFLKTLRP